MGTSLSGVSDLDASSEQGGYTRPTLPNLSIIKKSGNRQFSMRKNNPEIFVGGFCRKFCFFQEIFIFHWFLLNFTMFLQTSPTQSQWNSIGISGKWRFLEKVQNFRQNPPTKISGFVFLIENCRFPAFFMMLRLGRVRADFSLRPDHLLQGS